MKRKYFKAQSLALVMIILVVASIIGVSLFSRMSKEKESSISQQDSSIALSQSDAILDFFVGADIDLIEQNVLGEETQVTASGEDEILVLLESAGVDPSNISLDEEWCAGENSVDVTLEYAGNEDFFEVQPGSVLAFNLEGATATNFCELELRLKAVEDYAVFVIKKIIDNGIVSEEKSNYCIQRDSPTSCDSNDVPNVTDEENLGSPGSYVEAGSYFLMRHNLQAYINDGIVELRVIPIHGVLSVAVGVSGEEYIDKKFRPIKVTVDAVCNDAYRGKQMFLPASGNLGYSPLFDYAIYDSGLFQP
jgi:hypothetical protein